MKPKPLTPAQRQKRHRDTGANLTVVLTNPDAIAALAALREAHGGIKAGIEAALLFWFYNDGR